MVVLSGDHPLMSAELIGGLVATHAAERAAATILTTEELDPAGYGRVVRDADGAVEAIVETKSTEGVSAEQLAIREVNLGTYAFEAGELWSALDEVADDARRALPDRRLPAAAQPRGHALVTHGTRDVASALGVNDRVALMEADRMAQRGLLERHARAGRELPLPRVDHAWRPDVTIGRGHHDRPGSHAPRRTPRSAPAARSVRARRSPTRALGDGVTALHSFLVGATRGGGRLRSGPSRTCGPARGSARARRSGPSSRSRTRTSAQGAKVPHLSYLGDADVGEGANVAAGNITANYDGFAKHRTAIGKDAKTGVNASYVAPVSVGEGAYIGAGSVITEDVPDGALGISRPEQKNVEGYAERVERERR